jgi:hypothetical protein
MLLEILIAALIIIAGVIECYVYDQAIYWHSDEKRDPRNFPPPR